MKKLILCLLALVFLSSSGFIFVRTGPPAGGASCTVPDCYNFEEAGAPSNWTSAAGSFDDTNNPLEGSQSLRLEAGENATLDPNYDAATQSWTIWFQIDDSFDNDETFMRIRQSAGSNIITVNINGTTDHIYAVCGGASTTAEQSTTISATTTHKIRVYATADTGADDASVTIEYWNGSIWTDSISCSDGTTNGNIDHVIFYNNASPEIIDIDVVKNSATQISEP